MIISLVGLLVLRNTQHLFFKGAELSEPLATVAGASPGSSRRPYDSLNWIDTEIKTLVRNGDFLRTEDSELKLKMGSAEAAIKIAPHSLVRLSSWGGRLLIDLRKGDASIDPFAAQNIDIQGKKNETPPAQKDVALPEAQSTPAAPKKGPITKDLVVKGVQLYPKRNSVLLFRDGASLTLSLPFECKTPCNVRVTHNKQLVRESDLQGFPIQLMLHLSSKEQGLYEWSIEGDDVHEIGSFEAFIYSKARLQENLFQDKDIDVLR